MQYNYLKHFLQGTFKKQNVFVHCWSDSASVVERLICRGGGSNLLAAPLLYLGSAVITAILHPYCHSALPEKELHYFHCFAFLLGSGS